MAINKSSTKSKQKIKNRITLYRRRLALSQRRVATLLGYRDSSTLSVYESGRSMPPLPMAFRLAIVLRVPVEFLYPELYDSLRNHIRAEEERLDRTRHKHHSSTSPV
ncbi:MAG TPA: helix-turn-helix transcriptional regulator [Bryobacteraceae bacterium]|jgi:transcriptional regulator with XRE-family HTH domain|nr:helix-turn-helix transcriptional regulator [Bryobacteraceae bacterium]